MIRLAYPWSLGLLVFGLLLSLHLQVEGFTGRIAPIRSRVQSSQRHISLMHASGEPEPLKQTENERRVVKDGLDWARLTVGALTAFGAGFASPDTSRTIKGQYIGR